jgi:hypothetical protein
MWLALAAITLAALTSSLWQFSSIVSRSSARNRRPTTRRERPHVDNDRANWPTKE